MLALWTPLAGFVIVGVVAAVLLGPMRSGTLERNGRIGIRTRHTQASDRAWLAGHRAAVPWMTGMVAALGAATVVGAVAAAVLGEGAPDWSPLVVVAGGWGPALVCGIGAVRSANRAARAADVTDAEPRG